MMDLRRVAVVVVCCVMGWAGVARCDEMEAPTIEVPPGFAVEVVAAAPLVQHPMMAGFDERGRLFVADNAGVNLNAEELLEQRPNLIRMLEDTDGDGRFDRSTVFADEMTFPMGALWHEGALYVASPPYIWRLEDTTGDGVADVRDPIVGKFGFIGNAADIHGCFLGPNGRIYWCDGRHGHEFVDGEGRSLSKGQAARIFSCRADGSDIEVHCGGGMDNPVEVAFTAEGEMLGTMTFYNPDDARHDALVHYAYGGVYPRRHAVTAEFKWTGDFMPPLSLFGVVAPAGLTRYRGDLLGEEYRDNFFSVQFNTHKVVRHVLTRSGATFRCADEDFLTSPSVDFHPTDVFEDADGSLLVIDTGGWFRHGCPTSQVAKPEILGAIYRVRKIGAQPPSDPRGLAVDWSGLKAEQLCDLLDDARPAVRERAVGELAKRESAAVMALREVLVADLSHRERRQQAVWALGRIAGRTSDGAALAALREVLEDEDAGVLLPAIHSLATHRDRSAVERLLPLAAHRDPAVQREAAVALGRLGDARAVPVLLEALGTVHDRFVEHAILYALIEIDDAAATAEGLASPRPQIRRGALIALDQMDHGGLTREQVIPLLNTDDVALERTALEIVGRHDSWAAESTLFLKERLADQALTEEQRGLARGSLLALQGNAAVQQLVGDELLRGGQSRENRLMLLDVMARSSREGWPEIWNEPIARLLGADDDALAAAAIAAVERIDLASFEEKVRGVARDERRAEKVRRAALVALAKGERELAASELELLIGGLDGELDPLERLAVAEGLSAARLTSEQQERLVEALRIAGPIELPLLLKAYRAAGDETLGRALVAALEESPGRAALEAGAVREVLKAFPTTVVEAAGPLLASLSRDEAADEGRFEAMWKQLAAGDVARGREVFFGSRGACSACHRVRGVGGAIGPDLTTIGQVRTERDLLEAIVLPSKTLARGYESWSVTTVEGHAHVGVITSEGADGIVLRTTDRAELRIGRESIDELAPSRLSVMPQGLEQVLSTAELNDLVSFLRDQR